MIWDHYWRSGLRGWTRRAGGSVEVVPRGVRFGLLAAEWMMTYES